MEAWWYENKSHFTKDDMKPSGVVYRQYPRTLEGSEMAKSNVGAAACITATKGKLRKTSQYALEEEYEESHRKVRKLVFESHLPKPWKAEPVKWFQEVVRG